MAAAREQQTPQGIDSALEEFRQIAPTYGVEPTPPQIEQIRTYVSELLRWNEKINLTAAKEPEEVLLRHVLDSLVPLAHISPVNRLLDVGTGGGLPGIPIKIFRPELSIVLLEARRKKVSFNQHLVDKLELAGIELIWGRLGDAEIDESLAERPFDGIITRATLPGAQILRLGAGALRPGGTFFLMMGAMEQEQREALQEEATVLGVGRVRVFPYQLPGQNHEMNLVLVG